MTHKPKILALAGSLRKDSLNKKLVKIAMRGAQEHGAEVTYVDLRDLPMPIYDGDLEAAEGMPKNAQIFKDLLLGHQGLLIASPEYNSSISGVLKNAIDWASRPAPGEPMVYAFAGKVAALMSASPGGFGGLRGLVAVRSILGNIKVIVLPDQVCISSAHQAFDENGSLKDAKQEKSVLGLGEELAKVCAKLQPN